MKIRLKTLMAGPGGVVRPGEVVDLPGDQARELIAGGFAELAEKPKPEPPPIKTATAEAPERAVTRPRGKPKKKR
jgi:hypothetical protein